MQSIYDCIPEQDRQYTYYATLSHVRVTIIAVEKYFN
jgi:hypothetical protein